MDNASYVERRAELEHYFDRTASDTWAKLTSDAPVSRIRAVVRAGRDRMRAALLSTLPADLTGQRVLDAGCGTGALAVEAARRGADVVAIDLSASLIEHARARLQQNDLGDVGNGRIDFRVSDMLDPALGEFDWTVAMDSVIHYRGADMVEMIARLAVRNRRGLAFSFAPSTPLLMAMWAAGKLLPRADRSPAIEPIAEGDLRLRISQHPELVGFRVGKTVRIKSAFYTSQAMEILRA